MMIMTILGRGKTTIVEEVTTYAPVNWGYVLAFLFVVLAFIVVITYLTQRYYDRKEMREKRIQEYGERIARIETRLETKETKQEEKEDNAKDLSF